MLEEECEYSWPAGTPTLIMTVRCINNAMQVRPGNVLEMKGRLLQVMKFQHTQGAGRQLGNVQASLDAGIMSTKTFQTPCTPQASGLSCGQLHSAAVPWLQLEHRHLAAGGAPAATLSVACVLAAKL